MANHSEDHHEDVAPKGSHASANPEPMPLAGHAQRTGEDGCADDALQGSGKDSGARSDAAQSAADVEAGRSGTGTGARPRSGGSQGERTGGQGASLSGFRSMR